MFHKCTVKPEKTGTFLSEKIIKLTKMSIQCRVPAIQNAPNRLCPALNFYFLSMFVNLDKNVDRFSQVLLYYLRCRQGDRRHTKMPRNFHFIIKIPILWNRAYNVCKSTQTCQFQIIGTNIKTTWKFDYFSLPCADVYLDVNGRFILMPTWCFFAPKSIWQRVSRVGGFLPHLKPPKCPRSVQSGLAV